MFTVICICMHKLNIHIEKVKKKRNAEMIYVKLVKRS